VMCNRICARVCNGNVECADERDEDLDRFAAVPQCIELKAFFHDRDNCQAPLMWTCPGGETMPGYSPPSFDGAAWTQACIMDDQTCDGISDCRDSADESEALCGAAVDSEDAVPVLRRDWFGVMFSEAVEVKCIQVTQPDRTCRTTSDGVMKYMQTPSGSLKTMEVYACAKDSLLTAGSGLRKNIFGAKSPCRRMTDIKLNEVSDDQTCAEQSGTQEQQGASAIELNFQCDTTVGAQAVTINTARKIRADAEARGVPEEDVLKIVEYACYCDQQVAWQGMSILAPPYESAAQKVCDKYFTRVLRDYALLAVSAIGVVIVNFLLKLTMTILVDLERHASRTAANASLMTKLFWAQFVNTAIIVLVVKAYLHGALEKVPVIGSIKFVTDYVGAGQHDDINGKWFVSVGASTALAILLNVFSTAVPPTIMVYVRRLIIRFLFCLGLKPATQELLNQQFEEADFNLALRFSQVMNIVVTVICYSGGFPLLWWFGCVYLFGSFWLDKFVFLRGSKIPPMYTERVCQMACKLIPIGIVIHAFLSMWAFGSQEVFPSAAITQQILDEQARLEERRITAERLERYGLYLLRRVLDCFRWGTIWQFLLCAALGLFGAGYAVLVILGGGDEKRTLALFRKVYSCFMGCLCCCCRKSKVGTAADTKPKLYVDELEGMKKAGIIYDYEMVTNPRYRAAALAIAKQNERLDGTGTMAGIATTEGA